MKLRLEVELDSRYATIDVGKRAAELYGRWSESQDDDDFEALADEVMDDLKDRLVVVVLDAEIGR